MSVCSWVASVRPGVNGTITVVSPALLAAFSTPAQPARTIRSAIDTFLEPALNSAAIPSRVPSTLVSWAGLFTAQSRWGSRRIRAPFAPPRLSVPRKVEADAHAVDTSSETLSPLARTDAFKAAMSDSSIKAPSTAGTGSCQIKISAGTSDPT